MKLVKKIGTITLDRPIEWTNYHAIPIMAEAKSTIDGGAIVYELAAQTSARLIDLSSSDTGGIQGMTTKNAIVALASASIGATTTITTYEDEVIAVRFRYEDGAVDIEDKVGARLSDAYGIKIFLRMA
jgi:hypothetical protein